MEKEKVSVVKCENYNPELVGKALEESLQNINFHFRKGMRVLIKPNLLSPASPDKAITTNPVVVEELCKILKKNKCKIYIGESSSMNTDLAFKKCGINKLEKYAKIVNFEAQDKKFFDFGEHMHRVPLPKILFDVDLVINLAKMKTHGLTFVTLSVKNLYGCIPGELKSRYHNILPSIKKFSHLLIKVEETIKPGLNIIDGIVGMEGNGPGAAGERISSKVIVAGKDAFAVDIISSKIMGFDPKEIYTNRFSRYKHHEIEVLGSGKDVKLKFKKPSSASIPFFLHLSGLIPKSHITFDKEKCKKCHLCETKCPAKAISLKTGDGYPFCNWNKCISCLCCIEVCPNSAVILKEHWVRKLLKIIAKVFIKY